MNAFRIAVGDGIQDSHDVLAFEGGIVLEPPGKIAAVTEIICFIVVADFITYLSFFGFHVKPG
jgi:hypothetical protein